MHRRTLFGKVLAAVAVVAVGPAVTSAEAAPSRFNADWEAGYLSRQRVEALTALPVASKPDLSYGQGEPDYVRPEPAPLSCTRCGDPITDGYMIGDGDGTGQRFAHPECCRQFPGAYKSRAYQMTVLVGDAPAFEAMQAACAARGCWLTARDGLYIHDMPNEPSRRHTAVSQTFTDLPTLDRLRRSLHGEG